MGLGLPQMHCTGEKDRLAEEHTLGVAPHSRLFFAAVLLCSTLLPCTMRQAAMTADLLAQA